MAEYGRAGAGLLRRAFGMQVSFLGRAGVVHCVQGAVLYHLLNDTSAWRPGIL